MQNLRVLLTSGIFAMIALAPASASISLPAFVDARSGVDTGSCTITAPCASLNFALSTINSGGAIVFLTSGTFGPIVLTGSVSLNGADPDNHVQIVADPSAQVGCIGHLPGACGVPNNGYAVEVANTITDAVKINHLMMNMGGGNGAFKFSSGGAVQLSYDVFRGNVGSGTNPIVWLAPNNPSGGPAGIEPVVYFSYSDVGFNNYNNSNGGAVLVQPVGTTAMKLHFNHVEVHNASYGIRTDGSLLSNAGLVVSSFISESEFFAFTNAAMNAFSTTGTGTVVAVFDDVNVLSSAAGLKANGTQSNVLLTNCTVSGNTNGVQISNGASAYSSGNNTIFGNGVDVSGTLTTQAPK
jgi:hypothetical protein